MGSDMDLAGDTYGSLTQAGVPALSSAEARVTVASAGEIEEM